MTPDRPSLATTRTKLGMTLECDVEAGRRKETRLGSTVATRRGVRRDCGDGNDLIVAMVTTLLWRW